MADRDPPRPPGKFTIHRVTPPPPPPRPAPPAAAPPPPPDPPAAPEPKRKPKRKRADGPAAGGCFPTASGALAFLGSALGTGVTAETTVRRTADGMWWVELGRVGHEVTPLVLTAGGRPFVLTGTSWVAVNAAGDPTTADPLDVGGWSAAEFADLIADAVLPPGRYTGAAALDVVVPGPLGRVVLRRAAELGLGIGVVPVVRRPLRGTGAESGALVLRLRADRGAISPALVQTLTGLPYTAVGEPAANLSGSGGGLVIDVRCRPPLAAPMLAALIPEGETWVLGPPEVGYSRLRLAGGEVDGVTLLESAAATVADVPPAPPARLPAPIPVRLVGRRGDHRTDAVLLDDAELGWLRRLLMGRPAGEPTFVIPGDGAHLLTAPGGLAAAVPFGLPLVRVGPGGLYVQQGRAFDPPLPEAARRERFALGPGSAVVVTDRGAYRFAADRLTPAWALWVGAAPPVQDGLGPSGEHLLGALAMDIRVAEAEQARQLERQGKPRSRPSADPSGLLLEAQRLELAGDLLGAAAKLEEAGHHGPAGRLYERAASGLRPR